MAMLETLVRRELAGWIQPPGLDPFLT
jgi:hypothetical protein